MKNNLSERKRITSSRKMLKKKTDVLVLIALLTGIAIATNSCEADKVTTLDLPQTEQLSRLGAIPI